jgi:hypothetical protein
MTVDATTIARFFRRNKRGHKNDRHAVQGPIRFELRRDFRAVRMRHDKIDKYEVGLEAARGFQCSAWIVHRARDVIPGLFEKQTRAARELAAVIDNQNPD